MSFEFSVTKEELKRCKVGRRARDLSLTELAEDAENGRLVDPIEREPDWIKGASLREMN